MKRALITGASGFVGRYLVEQLVGSGHWDVHCVSRRGGEIEGAIVHNIDLTDYGAVIELFESCDFDVVFNCAAVVRVGSKGGKRGKWGKWGLGSKGRMGGEEMVRINCDITHFVVEGMLRQERKGLLVHLSSIAAMGVDNIERCSAYGRSKFLSENEVWRAHKMGLDVVVLRPSVVVGVGGQIEKVIRFIKRWGVFYTGGSCGFVDVTDVAKVAQMVANERQYWGKAWCVNGWNVSFFDFVKIFGGHPLIKIPDWVAGSMLSSKRSYEGSDIKFDYASIENCVHRINNDLR